MVWFKRVLLKNIHENYLIKPLAFTLQLSQGANITN